MPFAKWRKFMVGQGSGRAGFVGLFKQSTTAVGSVGAGEDNLQSLTLEADALYKNGQAVRITAFGSCAANGNNKTVKLHFGGTSICTTGAIAANDKKWILRALVIRTGSDAQDAIADGQFNDALVIPQFTALTKDDGAAIIVKCTGEATADNDIVQEGMTIEALTV
jgi:hypothetical protein